MNVFSKAYCRLYQTIFRVFLPFFPYREPEILLNYEDILRVLDENGYDNIMLVTGKTIRRLGLTQRLEEILKQDVLRGLLPNYKLNSVADYYGFTFNHHRAFDDACVTAKVFIELVKAKGKLE